jgi:probable F420-dependent oxidoreductase
MMKYSVGLPTCMEGMMFPVPFATPDQVVEVARRAEALGYDSVWGNDHMTTQQYVRGEFAEPPNFWDILITYAFVAAATTRLRVGTGMIVLPLRRDIVVLAKQIATLDQFSGGRLEIGVGIGAYREEFEALHPDWKVHRGDMVSEGIEALRTLFTERRASFEGKYYSFKDVEMFPKPRQARLPLHIGGNSPAGVERAARYADGWLPACLPVDTLRDSVERLKELAAGHGRDPAAFEIAPQYAVYVGTTHEEAVAKYRQSQMCKHFDSLSASTLKGQGGMDHCGINLIGDASGVIAKAEALKAAGATHLMGLYFAVNTVPELLEQMQVFAEEVIPDVG